MGKWAWQCTTTGLDNSIELRTEKIHQAVTEIWVPQVWQPPARPPARPPASPPARPPARPAARTVTTIPLQPGGLRGKKEYIPFFGHGYDTRLPSVSLTKAVCALVVVTFGSLQYHRHEFKLCINPGTLNSVSFPFIDELGSHLVHNQILK